MKNIFIQMEKIFMEVKYEKNKNFIIIYTYDI